MQNYWQNVINRHHLHDGLYRYEDLFRNWHAGRTCRSYEEKPIPQISNCQCLTCAYSYSQNHTRQPLEDRDDCLPHGGDAINGILRSNPRIYCPPRAMSLRSQSKNVRSRLFRSPSHTVSTYETCGRF